MSEAIFSQIGSSAELLQAELRDELVALVGSDKAKNLYISGCNFYDPYYWRDCPWKAEMPSQSKYRDLLGEAYDGYLTFPQLAILELVLERGIKKPGELGIDNEGTVRLDLPISDFMKQHGAEVLQRLVDRKAELVSRFLKDESGLIASALNTRINLSRAMPPTSSGNGSPHR